MFSLYYDCCATICLLYQYQHVLLLLLLYHFPLKVYLTLLILVG